MTMTVNNADRRANCSVPDRTLSATVVRLMAVRRMRTADIARRTGLSQSNLSMKLTGARPWTLADARRVAAALGEPLIALFAGIGPDWAQEEL